MMNNQPLEELPSSFKEGNRLEIYKIFYNLDLPSDLPTINETGEFSDQKLREVMGRYYTELIKKDDRLREVFSFNGQFYNPKIPKQLKEDSANLDIALRLLGFRIAEEIVEKSGRDLDSVREIAQKIVSTVVGSSYGARHKS
jgi:hypothetical protein